MSKEKILVVGGTGFLGNACLKELLDYEVTTIGREKKNYLESENHKYVMLDICDSKQVDFFLDKNYFSYLIFLGWPLTPPHNSIDHVLFSAKSIEFVLKFSNKNSLARILFIGSIHETGKTSGQVLANFEGTEPKNLYGISKKYVYDSLTVLLKGVSFCWVRLSNIYGIGDHSHKLLPTLIFSAIEKREDVFLDNSKSIIDFVHVKDAAHGIRLALLSSYNGIINIGSGNGYILEDVKKFINLKTKNERTVEINIPAFEATDSGPILDITDSATTIGYCPSIKIEDGINEWVEYVIKESKNEPN